MKSHDFLLELGTEELPPKLLLSLSNSLKDNLSNELNKLNKLNEALTKALKLHDPNKLNEALTEASRDSQ